MESQPNSATDQQRCVHCGAPLSSAATPCHACGYHQQGGRPAESPPAAASRAAGQSGGTNPYQAPASAESGAGGGTGLPGSRKTPLVGDFAADARLDWLEQRVNELERRVNGTRLVSPSFFSRMWAVVGYWFLALSGR